MTPAVVGLIILVTVGAAVGSFLNVVIARLPRKMSVVTPASHCPACHAPIRWHDNVPLVSYFWLRGRCRDCESRIGWRYPVVEGGTAFLFAVGALRFGLTPALLPALILFSALIAVTVIDLDHQLIPDSITLPGIVVGFLVSVATQRLSWLDSLMGVLVGGGIFLVIILASRGGMGGGDMKLGAMIGAFLGWKSTLVALLLAVILGGIAAVFLLTTGARGRKDPIPFGPFLALSAVVSFSWGESFLRWYLRSLAD